MSQREGPLSERHSHWARLQLHNQGDVNVRFEVWRSDRQFLGGINQFSGFPISSLNAILLELGNYDGGLDALLKYDVYGGRELTN
jgi:hypothetical protein